MARQINTADRGVDKLVKLIPTEVVTAYIAVAALLGFGGGDAQAAIIDPALGNALIQIVFFVLLIATPLYAWKQNAVQDKGQLAAITIAFVVWTYSLGGPFVVWGWHHPVIGSTLLILWTVLAPLFWREPAGAGALGEI
jgi:hypothetical protein